MIVIRALIGTAGFLGLVLVLSIAASISWAVANWPKPQRGF